jgi:hypothetical protein
MRYFLSSLCWILCCVVADPLVLALASEPSLADPLDTHRSLADDDAYVRHGAITTMQTCLAVAEDPLANRLWHERAGHAQARKFLIPESYKTLAHQHEFADWLARPGNDIRSRRGYGTLLTCAQIVSTWRTTASTGLTPPVGDGHSERDGRIEHGLIVIDLDIGDGTRALVDSVPLARILTSREVLPQAAYGGVVLRNAIIAGPLLLNNLHLSIPLTLSRVVFSGGHYPRDIFNIRQDIKNRAISILNSQFSDQFVITDSVLCGDVGILDSQFQESLVLRYVRQGSTVCPNNQSHAEDGDSRRGSENFILIQASRFQQGLKISKSDIKSMHVQNSIVENFWSTSSNFGQILEVIDNTIGSIYLDEAILAKSVIFSNNRIANDFSAYGRSKPASHDVPIESIQIISNTIGGGFGFLDFPLSVIPDELNFKSNHVGNGSKICLPMSWNGRLSLAGSSYDGILTVGLFDAVGTENWSEAYNADRPCGQGAFFVGQAPRQDKYCKTEEYLEIDFEASTIRTLRWHLPIDCRYRWSGFGLSYNLWLPHPDAGDFFESNTSDETKLVAFRAWRTTLTSFAPAPLDMMGRYLSDKGYSVDSRDIQIEAKRLNYAPECSPDRPFIRCFHELLVPSTTDARPATTTTAAEANVAPAIALDQYSLSRLESRLSEVRRSIALLYLWPVGFGAAPELAIGWMFGGMVCFWGIYTFYSRVWQPLRFRMARNKLRQILADISKCSALDVAWLEGMRRRMNELKTETRDKQKVAQDLQKVIGKIRDDLLIDETGLHVMDVLDRMKNISWPVEPNHYWHAINGVREAVKIIPEDVSEQNLSPIGRLTSGLDRLESSEPTEDGWDELIEFAQEVRAIVEPRLVRDDRLARRLRRLGNVNLNAGRTKVFGFSGFSTEQHPTKFTMWRYSMDAMIPVIDLHAYSTYYPESPWMRAVTVVQHICGWWWLTVFIASAAIL